MDCSVYQGNDTSDDERSNVESAPRNVSFVRRWRESADAKWSLIPNLDTDDDLDFSEFKAYCDAAKLEWQSDSMYFVQRAFNDAIADEVINEVTDLPVVNEGMQWPIWPLENLSCHSDTYSTELYESVESGGQSHLLTMWLEDNSHKDSSLARPQLLPTASQPSSVDFPNKMTCPTMVCDTQMSVSAGGDRLCNR